MLSGLTSFFAGVFQLSIIPYLIIPVIFYFLIVLIIRIILF